MRQSGKVCKACMALLLSLTMCVPNMAYTGMAQTVEAEETVSSGENEDVNVRTVEVSLGEAKKIFYSLGETLKLKVTGIENDTADSYTWEWRQGWFIGGSYNSSMGFYGNMEGETTDEITVTPTGDVPYECIRHGTDGNCYATFELVELLPLGTTCDASDRYFQPAKTAKYLIQFQDGKDTSIDIRKENENGGYESIIDTGNFVTSNPISIDYDTNFAVEIELSAGEPYKICYGKGFTIYEDTIDASISGFPGTIGDYGRVSDYYSATVPKNTKLTFTATATSSVGQVSYQWYKDGEPLEGETSASYAYEGTESGLYTCHVSDGVCEKTVTAGSISLSSESDAENETVVQDGDIIYTIKDGVVLSSCARDTGTDRSITSFPDGVTGLAAYALNGIANLTTVTLPDGFKNLSEHAFAESHIEEVTIPGSVSVIPRYCFHFAYDLKSVTLEDGVQKIEGESFLSAPLERIVIPKSVTEIGKYAIGYNFSKNGNNKKSSNPPTIYCYKKSAAHTYAIENGIPYVLFDPDAQETLSDSNVTLNVKKTIYTGRALTPAVKVKDAAGNTLTEGTDYTVTYTNNTEVGTATVTITGINDYTGTVTKTFAIEEANQSEPTAAPTAAPVTAFLYGDVDENGKVDASDALSVLRAVVKLATLADMQETAADVDGSGSVEAKDALLILQKVVKLIDIFPAETVENGDALANLASLKDVRESLVKDMDSLVTLGKYKGVEVTITAATVSDAQVEKRITSNLENAGEYEQITEGTVADGDTVNIDYVGTIDGKEFSGGSAENVNLEIGSDSFIDGFEDGLIGASVGDTVELNLTFPDDYSNEDLAGQDAVFTVTIV